MGKNVQYTFETEKIKIKRKWTDAERQSKEHILISHASTFTAVTFERKKLLLIAKLQYFKKCLPQHNILKALLPSSKLFFNTFFRLRPHRSFWLVHVDCCSNFDFSLKNLL